MNTLHLFAGAGGGLYADLILGHRPIGAVEIEGYCCDVLRQQRDAGWFPGLRVHHCDITKWDASEYAGRVGGVHAGFPCQDISLSGNGAGIARGARSGLWRFVADTVSGLRPPWVFLENSPAITSRGLDIVLGDLSALGYDAEWITLAASQVGAPHIRNRWWCLARLADTSGRRRRKSPGGQVQQPWRAKAISSSNDTHAHSQRCQERRVLQRRQSQANRVCSDDPNANGRGQQWSKRILRDRSAEAIRGGAEYSNPNSARLEKHQPGQEQNQQQTTERARAHSGWWAAEPAVGRVAHGVANRKHRIKALGNGQVPLQAATAYTILMQRFDYGQS